MSEGPALEREDIEHLVPGQRGFEECLAFATAPALKVLADEQTEIASVGTTRREGGRESGREEGRMGKKQRYRGSRSRNRIPLPHNPRIVTHPPPPIPKLLSALSI